MLAKWCSLLSVEAVMGFSCDVGECSCPSRLLAMALLFLVSKIWGSEADTGTRKHMPESYLNLS